MGRAKAMRQKLVKVGVAPSCPIHLTNKPMEPQSIPVINTSKYPFFSSCGTLFIIKMPLFYIALYQEILHDVNKAALDGNDMKAVLAGYYRAALHGMPSKNAITVGSDLHRRHPYDALR